MYTSKQNTSSMNLNKIHLVMKLNEIHLITFIASFVLHIPSPSFSELHMQY